MARTSRTASTTAPGSTSTSDRGGSTRPRRLLGVAAVVLSAACAGMGTSFAAGVSGQQGPVLEASAEGAAAAPSTPAVPRANVTPHRPAKVLPPAASAVPKGDLPGWRQTFVEDFTTDAPLGSFPGVYGGRWSGYEGWRDTSGEGLYAESRVVSVAGGMMDMHLRTEGGQPLVAAPMPTISERAHGQLYGKFSVRFRADPVPGYKTAWLLWPDSDDWMEGEINFPEGPLAGSIHAFNHRVDEPLHNALGMDTGITYTGWHTASIEWSPDKVVYLLDGAVLGISTEAPATPMHWVLQTETELDGAPPPPGASGHVQVDWVTIYERT